MITEIKAQNLAQEFHSSNELVEQEELLVSNDQGLSAEQVVAVSSRLSYNNGYGDFCFGRLIDRRDKTVDPKASKKNQKLLSSVTSSNGVPIVELDNFER
jgi:hypothetical protein